MPEYLRPGVYYERVDSANGNRLLIRSDVAAFIGIAQKGPVDTPIPVESLRQYQAYFGDYIGAGYLSYCVRAFFDNGGRRCWIVRVASRDFDQRSGLGARPAAISVSNGSEAVWSIEASSEGSWGNQLEIALLEEHLADTSIAVAALSASGAKVTTTAGFERGTLVVIAQEDSTGTLQNYRRVISHVDEERQWLYWQHPDAGKGLVYDEALTAVDANRGARIHSISYRLVVNQRGRLIASYSNLGLVPEHANYGPRLLNGEFFQFDQTREALGQTSAAPEPIVIKPLKAVITRIPDALQIQTLNFKPLEGGQDGLARLSITDFIGEDFSSHDSDRVRRQKNRGISTLHGVDEITLVAIPDIVIQPQADPEFLPDQPASLNPCVPCPPPAEPVREFKAPPMNLELPPVFSDADVFQVQSALIAHCESRGDRFAVIDPPFHIAQNSEAGIAEIRAWRSRFDSSYAAIYYSWLKVIEPRGANNVFSGALFDTVRAIPACGHALGQYALFDNETGVHRAPANRPLKWNQDLTLHTSFGQQELFNTLGINAIRSEGPRGIRIMGARTLSSDPDWRFINVRRLLIMIRRTLYIISQWVVFEPNNATTRNKFQLAISSYLTALWARGALTGETAAQAFFVKCDEENNPAAQRSNGALLAEVGVAPSYPFEFIVIRVGMKENELEISESSGIASAA